MGESGHWICDIRRDNQDPKLYPERTNSTLESYQCDSYSYNGAELPRWRYEAEHRNEEKNRTRMTRTMRILADRVDRTKDLGGFRNLQGLGIKKVPGTHLNIFSIRKRYTTGLRTIVSTLIDDLAVAVTSTVFTCN